MDQWVTPLRAGEYAAFEVSQNLSLSAGTQAVHFAGTEITGLDFQNEDQNLCNACAALPASDCRFLKKSRQGSWPGIYFSKLPKLKRAGSSDGATSCQRSGMEMGALARRRTE